MSLAKDNIWKLLAPLVVMGVMFLIPVPDGYAAAGVALLCSVCGNDCRHDPRANSGNGDQFYCGYYLRYWQ